MCAQKIDRDRSPEGRFIYLAEKRVNKALTAISSVGKLSEKKNYSYTEAQAAEIINELEDAVAELKGLFEREHLKGTRKFSFKEK